MYFPSSLWTTSSGSTLLLLSPCVKNSVKLLKHFRKRKTGEQESHSFWSASSIAKQLWSLSWSAPQFCCVGGCDFFFSLCVPWLTEHLIKCVEKEEKRGRRLAIKAVLVLRWNASSSVRNMSQAKQKGQDPAIHKTPCLYVGFWISLCEKCGQRPAVLGGPQGERCV